MTPSQQQLAISLLKQAVITFKILGREDLPICHDFIDLIAEVDEMGSFASFILELESVETDFKRRFNDKIQNALEQDA